MEKRTKLWRRKQAFRVFKARMIYYASFERECYYADDSHHLPLHWFELAKEHWTQVYRSTASPSVCCQRKHSNICSFWALNIASDSS